MTISLSLFLSEFFDACKNAIAFCLALHSQISSIQTLVNSDFQNRCQPFTWQQMRPGSRQQTELAGLMAPHEVSSQSSKNTVFSAFFGNNGATLLPRFNGFTVSLLTHVGAIPQVSCQQC